MKPLVGTIKDKVSLLKNSKCICFIDYIVIKSKKDHIYEEERLKLLEGMCFGEWGLLYNKERSASAIAIEDTDLFTLNKEYFDISFAVILYSFRNA